MFLSDLAVGDVSKRHYLITRNDVSQQLKVLRLLRLAVRLRRKSRFIEAVGSNERLCV
jgi:hypothetical protein